MIILISIYLLSIVGCRWTFRRMGSRYTDLWLDEDCTITPLWFIPILNTFLAMGTFIMFLGNCKFNRSKSKFIRKLFNEDYED